MDRHERKIAMAVAKPPDLRAKDILIAPETDHTNETQNEHRSPYELYQMTLPHIIDSNARVHRLVAIQKKKQRVININPNIKFVYFYFHYIIEILFGKIEKTFRHYWNRCRFFKYPS